MSAIRKKFSSGVKFPGIGSKNNQVNLPPLLRLSLLVREISANSEVELINSDEEFYHMSLREEKLFSSFTSSPSRVSN